MKLTESYAMWPAASVAGYLYLSRQESDRVRDLLSREAGTAAASLRTPIAAWLKGLPGDIETPYVDRVAPFFAERVAVNSRNGKDARAPPQVCGPGPIGSSSPQYRSI